MKLLHGKDTLVSVKFAPFTNVDQCKDAMFDRRFFWCTISFLAIYIAIDFESGWWLCFIGIISKCRGSSIGVLVCGPKEMRHDVARICSSGVTENLHFESISFSWWFLVQLRISSTSKIFFFLFFFSFFLQLCFC